MLELTLIIIALFVLVIAAYVDIRTLEVPDWLNYAGIAAGIGVHLILSAQQSSWWPIASSGIGLAIGFAIACLMFYTGQWGGGDAKLLMAMGALVGFEADKFSLGADFLINLVFVGGAWGLIWSTGLAVKNRKQFWTTFRTTMHQKPYARLRIMSLISAAILIIAAFVIAHLKIELLGLALVSYLLCYLVIFIKSTELSCMHKWITPDKVTEGDWLVNTVKVGNIEITPAKLGLQKTQVHQLKQLYEQKKIDKILVKYGIPFTPAFLIAFIAALYVGNIILAFF